MIGANRQIQCHLTLSVRGCAIPSRLIRENIILQRSFLAFRVTRLYLKSGAPDGREIMRVDDEECAIHTLFVALPFLAFVETEFWWNTCMDSRLLPLNCRTLFREQYLVVLGTQVTENDHVVAHLTR